MLEGTQGECAGEAAVGGDDEVDAPAEPLIEGGIPTQRTGEDAGLGAEAVDEEAGLDGVAVHAVEGGDGDGKYGARRLFRDAGDEAGDFVDDETFGQAFGGEPGGREGRDWIDGDLEAVGTAEHGVIEVAIESDLWFAVEDIDTADAGIDSARRVGDGADVVVAVSGLVQGDINLAGGFERPGAATPLVGEVFADGFGDERKHGACADDVAGVEHLDDADLHRRSEAGHFLSIDHAGQNAVVSACVAGLDVHDVPVRGDGSCDGAAIAPPLEAIWCGAGVGRIQRDGGAGADEAVLSHAGGLGGG